MRVGAGGGGEVLEDVLEGDAEASFQAEGEDLDGDATTRTALGRKPQLCTAHVICVLH